MISRGFCSFGVMVLGFLIGGSFALADPGALGRGLAEPGSLKTSTGSDSIVGADFDGDLKPDVVVETAAGHGYVLQIQFSTRIPAASLAFDGLGPGLRVVSQDINQDNDADLIVTSCTSLIPIAVFLGDGKGHFRPDSPWNYVPVGLNAPCRFGSPATREYTAGNAPENRQFSANTSCSGIPEPGLNLQPLRSGGTGNHATQISAYARSFRGPPAA